MERIYRMRYDYELTLAELFKERFLDELNAWCRACGVKSRIQAYGKGCMPVESLMDVDIPECETWYHKENGEIFPDDKMSGHGYKMVNKLRARISRARTSSAAKRSPTRASSSTRRSNASRSRVT